MNKFNVRVDYSLNGEDYLVTEGLKIAEIWDASETYLPDFTPDWLYDLLNNLPGEYDELQESVFECSDEFLEALKNHPDCKKYEEVGKNEEKVTGKFNVKVELGCPENEPGYYGCVYIWDASEEFLPDFTPDWLYEILDSLPGFHEESMESVFECDDEFLEALKNHPDCKKYEEVGKNEEEEGLRDRK